MARDCKALVVASNQIAPMANQKAIVTYYECGRQGHNKSECPKLRIKNEETKLGTKKVVEK
ncbi:hypothetical protein Tco_0198506, partial [Tanacetum coccineum]